MRTIFFQNLGEHAKKDKSIFMLFADLGVKFFYGLKAIDPKRCIDVGVAEANMVDMAAGLAMSGKNVYCYSIIPFLIARTLDQIKVDLAYNNLNVKLVGAGGGIVYGLEGVTHHSIEDIAVMRSLPNFAVVAPGDVKEAEALVEESVNWQGPLYMRFGRDGQSNVHEKEIDFKIGRGIVVKEGEKVCLIATGSMLYCAKMAAENLKEKGYNPTLVSMHTIKPLDEELVKRLARESKIIFTLEDHSVLGGLGSAVAEVLVESDYKGAFRRIGLPDQYTKEIGRPDYLLEKLGLDTRSITNYILKILETYGI